MSKNDSTGTNYTKWTTNSKFKDFSRSKKAPFSRDPRPGMKNLEIQDFQVAYEPWPLQHVKPQAMAKIIAKQVSDIVAGDKIYHYTM